MNQQVSDLLFRAEGTFFAESDASTLLTYADGVLARLEAVQAIERAETAILDEVVDVVFGQHPSIPDQHGTGASFRVRRDQAMVLRYATTAMLMHDEGFIRDKLAVWLRTIMLALCKPEAVMLGYRALMTACDHHLAAEDAAAIRPYVQVMIDEIAPSVGRPS
jgi:hypothetical protein